MRSFPLLWLLIMPTAHYRGDEMQRGSGTTTRGKIGLVCPARLMDESDSSCLDGTTDEKHSLS